MYVSSWSIQYGSQVFFFSLVFIIDRNDFPQEDNDIDTELATILVVFFFLTVAAVMVIVTVASTVAVVAESVSFGVVWLLSSWREFPVRDELSVPILLWRVENVGVVFLRRPDGSVEPCPVAAV